MKGKTPAQRYEGDIRNAIEEKGWIAYDVTDVRSHEDRVASLASGAVPVLEEGRKYAISPEIKGPTPEYFDSVEARLEETQASITLPSGGRFGWNRFHFSPGVEHVEVRTKEDLSLVPYSDFVEALGSLPEL